MLHPTLQALIIKLQAKCKTNGLTIGISECYRTVAEQNALYAKGRTTSGNIVTNAKGSSYSSMHQWYIAFDFYRNDGTGAYNDTDGFFSKVGKIGQSLGLEWGGSWTSPVDLPHFQLPDWGSTPSKLKSTYGTPEQFKNSWTKTTTKIAQEDDEVIEKDKIIVDGKEFTVELIRKDGTTYIKTRDIAEVLGLKVGSKGKIPVLNK